MFGQQFHRTNGGHTLKIMAIMGSPHTDNTLDISAYSLVYFACIGLA
jgi:hypothetical protein